MSFEKILLASAIVACTGLIGCLLIGAAIQPLFLSLFPNADPGVPMGIALGISIIIGIVICSRIKELK